MDPAGGETYEFGPFRLDTERHLLLKSGTVVPITPKVYDLLLIFLTRNGSLLTKAQLMEAGWGDTAVEENNLNQVVSALRKALGEGQNGSRYIETVPRLGYRFVADVRTGVGAPAPASPPPVASRGAPLAFGVVVGIVVLVAAVMAVIAELRRDPAPPAADGGHAIAVLPFLPMGSSADEYLGVGMADALITRLGNLKEIAVRPTSAIDDFGDSARDPIALGRRLGVDTVLDGRMQRADGRLRLTAQLIDVRSGSTLWSGRFDEPWRDVFVMQDAIAERLADVLVPRLTEEMRGRLGHRRVNVEAYEHYVRGRFFWNKRSPDGFRQARQAFEAAIEEDPLYADAYAGLADAYNLMPEYGVMPALEAMPRARAAARRALEINPALAEAHASHAYTLANFDYDFAEAERSFKRAIDFNPSYATAHQWYGEVLGAIGRVHESTAAFQRAQRLDPLSPIIAALAEVSYCLLGQPDRAIDGLKRLTAAQPEFAMSHLYLAQLYERAGRPEAALEWIEAYRLLGSSPAFVARLRTAYEAEGLVGIWKQRLTELLADPNRSPVNIALLYANLDQPDKALEWLEQAYADRDRFVIFLRGYPEFARLESNARYQDLLKRVGL